MQDILGYLFEKFKEGEATEEELKAVEAFVESSRKVLNENQPLTSGQVGGSFGVYLQDRTQLVFCGDYAEPGKMSDTPAVPVTHGNVGAVQPGMQSMANDFTVGVTKGDSNQPSQRKV